MKIFFLLFFVISISALSQQQSDSVRFKKKYELGLLSREDYQFLLKARAELNKMKQESMDAIIYKKRKEAFIEGLKKLIDIEDQQPQFQYGHNAQLQLLGKWY